MPHLPRTSHPNYVVSRIRHRSRVTVPVQHTAETPHTQQKITAFTHMTVPARMFAFRTTTHVDGGDSGGGWQSAHALTIPICTHACELRARAHAFSLSLAPQTLTSVNIERPNLRARARTSLRKRSTRVHMLANHSQTLRRACRISMGRKTAARIYTADNQNNNTAAR